MRPRIVSLGYAVPPHSYTQEEVFEALKYPKHFWPIYRDSQIERRYFAVPIEHIGGLSFQEQQEEYAQQAPLLAQKALLRALDGRSPQDLGLLSYSTCTGFPPGPTVGTEVARLLKLHPSIEITNLSAQGCEGSFPGLRRCHDFVAMRPGDMAAAIACELCSLTYYPEPPGFADPENHYELMRANSVFADACSCAIVGCEDNPRHPAIIDFASYLDTSYCDELGYIWRQGRLHTRLSRRVPEIAANLVEIVVRELLERNSLRTEDIPHWVLHPPGAAVLDLFRDKFGLPEEKIKYCRKALRLFGNCSSATVGIVAKLLMEEEPAPRGYLVMANVGPGMVANSLLCEFA